MFTKIDIKKFGLYKDFTWHPTKMQVFDQVNIIYGRNYSGKTTLSRIFDGVSQGVLHKNYLDGQFTLYTDDSSVPEVKESNMSDCPYLVRVYNSDYVGRNLGWLRNEDAGEIRSFTLLGARNNEAETDIQNINEQLGSVEEKKGLEYDYACKNEAYSTKKTAHDTEVLNLDNQLKDKANNYIKKKNEYVKLGQNYNVTHLQKDINQFVTVENIVVDEEGKTLENPVVRYVVDNSVELTDEKKEQLKKTIEEKEKSTIEKLPDIEPHLTQYYEQVKELVPKAITLSKTLQELIDNDLLQTWVDQGRELNKERTTCAFCGGPLTKERWEALDAHFSKESEELKTKLQSLKVTLEKASLALDDYLERKGFKKENIYASYLSDYAGVMELWGTFVENYKNAVGQLVAPITERLGNIFKPVNVDGLKVEVNGYKEFEDAYNALVEKNNAYGLKLDSEKDDARLKLRHDYVYSFCSDIKYAERKEKQAKEDSELEKEKEEVDKLAAKIKELKAQRKQRELDKKDEGKAAAKVSELLVKHFGAGSLSLEPEQVNEVDEDTGEVIPHTKFVVKRGTDYAKNLSEGERSLIGFCYFIAQMADELEGPDACRLVIFIDDPISSLDSSHIFFMYSLIDTVIAKPKKYGQLFISTHNLEFLKFLKRLKLPGNVNDKNVQHFVVEKLRKGDDEYKCDIKMMPDYLKDYVTEYNFLFQQVYDVARPISGKKEEKYKNIYSQYYNVANNMRKFLECYLFYRYPDSDEPTVDHLDDLFEGTERSEVNRVINEYSHLAWAERGLKVIDVPEIEKAAKLILKALKEKDPAHFSVLCKSVDVDENIDLSLTA